MPKMNMVEAIRNALRLEMDRDERVIVMGEDVGHLGGVFRATDGLQQYFGSARVVDTPLAEAVIAGSALGLAMSGLVPVIEIQFLGFTQNAFHQICQQIARSRFRTRGVYPAQIVIRTPFGGGVRTPEYHSDSMEAVYAQGTGLKVVLPATAYDAKGLLLEAIRDPDPVLYLEPLRGYRMISGEVPVTDYTVPFGKLRVVREGTDVTLVAWSGAVPVAEQAAEQLAEQGISAHVVDLRTLVPLDEEGLVAAVEKTGRCVVVHESPATAGFGAEVITLLQEQAFYSLEAPMQRVTAPDAPYPMYMLENYYVPDAARVVHAVEQTLSD
jgi:pyruvate dehydrogenase E1 component beta subunit